MELALVGHVPGEKLSDHGVRDTVRRLRSDGWTTVYADSSAKVMASAVGSGLGIPVAVEHQLSLSDVVECNPGRKIIAVCEPEAARAFVARAADVSHDTVPIPLAGSLTRVRVSRSGTHTLVSLNETLHLRDSFSMKGGMQ